MDEGNSNRVSLLDPFFRDLPKVEEDMCLVEINKSSTVRGLDKPKMCHSMSLDCNAIKKRKKIWEVNPSNLSTFMKLNSIENIPELKRKSKSFHVKKCSSKIQLEGKPCRAMTDPRIMDIESEEKGPNVMTEPGWY